VLTGTLAAINLTLAASNNLVYHQASAAYFDTFTMTTNDNGNTGIGGPLSDIDHFAMSGSPWLPGPQFAPVTPSDGVHDHSFFLV
jgi:hypothetical protein